MKTGYTIERLKALRTRVLADGVIDWHETDALLVAARALAVRHGIDFEDFERLLVKCRRDLKITREESDQLARQLDYLCMAAYRARRRVWLAVAGLLALASSVIILTIGVIRANRVPGEAALPDSEIVVPEP